MKTSGKISRYTAAGIATVLLHTGILFMPVVLPLRNTGTSSAEIVRTPPVTLFLTSASSSAGTTVRIPAAGDSAGSAAELSTGSDTSAGSPEAPQTTDSTVLQTTAAATPQTTVAPQNTAVAPQTTATIQTTAATPQTTAARTGFGTGHSNEASAGTVDSAVADTAAQQNTGSGQLPASASAGTTVRVPAAGDSAGSAADSSGTGSRTLLSLLDKKIREQLVYPETARRRALEGTVTIRICINADGTLSTYRITAGSGSPTLDAAASKLIESVFPLPGGLSSVPVETTISIQYTLTQNLH